MPPSMALSMVSSRAPSIVPTSPSIAPNESDDATDYATDDVSDGGGDGDVGGVEDLAWEEEPPLQPSPFSTDDEEEPPPEMAQAPIDAPEQKEGMEYATLDPNRLIMLVTGGGDDSENTLSLLLRYFANAPPFMHAFIGWFDTAHGRLATDEGRITIEPLPTQAEFTSRAR